MYSIYYQLYLTQLQPTMQIKITSTPNRARVKTEQKIKYKSIYTTDVPSKSKLQEHQTFQMLLQQKRQFVVPLIISSHVY